MKFSFSFKAAMLIVACISIALPVQIFSRARIRIRSARHLGKALRFIGNAHQSHSQNPYSTKDGILLGFITSMVARYVLLIIRSLKRWMFISSDEADQDSSNELDYILGGSMTFNEEIVATMGVSLLACCFMPTLASIITVVICSAISLSYTLICIWGFQDE